MATIYSFANVGPVIKVTETTDSAVTKALFFKPEQVKELPADSKIRFDNGNEALVLSHSQSGGTYADYSSFVSGIESLIASCTTKVDVQEFTGTFNTTNLATSANQDAGNISLANILSQLVTNQNIGGKSESLTPDTLAVTASSAYASGNLVGNKMKFTGILGAKKTGILHSLCIRDISNTAKLPMQLIIFNADPSATIFTDKSAFTINAADKAKIMRSIPISASDYTTIGGVAIVDLRNLGGVIKSATQDLFACLVATGAGSGNFSATTDLNISIGVIQD